MNAPVINLGSAKTLEELKLLAETEYTRRQHYEQTKGLKFTHDQVEKEYLKRKLAMLAQGHRPAPAPAPAPASHVTGLLNSMRDYFIEESIPFPPNADLGEFRKTLIKIGDFDPHMEYEYKMLKKEYPNIDTYFVPMSSKQLKGIARYPLHQPVQNYPISQAPGFYNRHINYHQPPAFSIPASLHNTPTRAPVNEGMIYTRHYDQVQGPAFTQAQIDAMYKEQSKNIKYLPKTGEHYLDITPAEQALYARLGTYQPVSNNSFKSKNIEDLLKQLLNK